MNWLRGTSCFQATVIMLPPFESRSPLLKLDVAWNAECLEGDRWLEDVGGGDESSRDSPGVSIFSSIAESEFRFRFKVLGAWVAAGGVGSNGVGRRIFGAAGELGCCCRVRFSIVCPRVAWKAVTGVLFVFSMAFSSSTCKPMNWKNHKQIFQQFINNFSMYVLDLIYPLNVL